MVRSRFDDEYERELFQRAQSGDLMARRELHVRYKGFLDNIVRQNYNVGGSVSYDAIRDMAEELFDENISKVDLSRDTKPSTYLTNIISGKLKRYTNERRGPIRATEQYAFDGSNFRLAQDELVQKLKRTPTIGEIQKHMNTKWPSKKYDIKTVERLKDLNRTTVLATSVVGRSEDSNFTEMDRAFSSREDEVDMFTDYLTMVKARELMLKVNTLPEPHKTILEHVHQLNNKPKLSYRDLAIKLGISKYRVEQYIKDAEEMLKR